MEWERWSTRMHLLVTDPEALPAARALVDAELDAIELAASRFRPDSEVCALADADGARVPVSPVLADLIAAALEAARATDGDVDPTVGCALVALGYDDDISRAGFSQTGVSQTGTAMPRIASVTVPVTWTAIEFDGQSVRMPAGTLLDLGATAKAAAADRCARQVHDSLGTGVLVNLGGDIATAGPTPDGGWQVLVQDTDDDPACQIALYSDAGLATSSTRRRRWFRAGEAHHHIVDPRTGKSVDPVWRSVSVGAHSCLEANTLSTAAIIRGDRAPGWLASLDIPARFIGQDGSVRTVGGWPE